MQRQKIKAVLGEPVPLLLPSNPTTGYSWYIISVSGGKVSYEEKYVSSGKAPGTGGVHTFIFTPETPTKVEITLHYKRNWEKDVSPKNELVVELETT